MRAIVALAIGASLIWLSGCASAVGNSGSHLQPALHIFQTGQERISPEPRPEHATPITSDSQDDGSALV